MEDSTDHFRLLNLLQIGENLEVFIKINLLAKNHVHMKRVESSFLWAFLGKERPAFYFLSEFGEVRKCLPISWKYMVAEVALNLVDSKGSI